MFSKYSIKLQLLLGIILGILNYGVNCLQEAFNPVPLYMDTLFTVTASFLGVFSGTICAAMYHILCCILKNRELSSLCWSICSFSIVLIIRLFIRYHNKNIKRKPEFLEMLFLIFVIVIVISLEGAIIFTILQAVVKYREDSQVRQMYLLLIRNNIPVFVSAFLPRLPVNILDKGICVTLGYFCFRWIEKLTEKKSEKKLEK